MKHLTLQIAKAATAVLFTFVLTLSSFAQYQIRNYDSKCGASSGADYGRSIINRVDNGYVIAGYSYASACGIGPFDWMFLRMKSNGNPDLFKLFGTQADDKCYSVIQSPNDSGYVMAGYMYDQSTFKNRATIVKLNKSGTLQYSKIIYDSTASVYSQIVNDPANVRGLTGWEEKKFGDKSRNKILASQYSTAGVLNWAYRYDSWSSSTVVSKSIEEAYSICFQPAGGVYGLAARTNFYSGAANIWDIMVVKLSYSGNVIWKKVYRFNMPSTNYYPSSEPRKIIPMTDGGFVIVGSTNAYVQTESDIVVFRVAANGNLMWSNTYGNTGFLEYGNSVVSDGNNLTIAGYRKRSTTSPDALLMKIPVAGGAPLWTRIWDPASTSEAGFDLVRSTTGAVDGFAITGDAIRTSNDAFLWRTNNDGNIVGGDCNNSVGMQYYTNPHKLDSFALVKVKLNEKEFNPLVATPQIANDTLCIGTAAAPEESIHDNINETEVTDYSLAQNYPNPFNPVTSIKFDIPKDGLVKIRIYDITGKEVHTLINEFKSAGRHKAEFNAGSLSTGVYYYKIESGNFTDIKKMILIK